MGFLHNFFARKSELEFLTAKCAWQDAEIAKVETKLALAEKALKDERSKKDKFVNLYCDQVSKQVGLSPVFAKASEPEKPPVIDTYSFEEEEKFRVAAEEMRKSDIENNIEPPPVESYIEIIKSNPDRYILN